MSAKGTRHAKKRINGWIKFLILFLLIIIAAGGFIFSPYGNNVLRDLSGDRDTPMDAVVKKLLVSQTEEQGVTSDNTIGQVTSLISDTPMNVIIEATEDKEVAVELVKEKFGFDDDYANSIVDVAFDNEKVQAIMMDIQESKWIDSMNKVKELKSSGELNVIREKINEASSSDVKSLQDEASSILNSN